MQIQNMTTVDCLSMLAGARLARLGCVKDGQPYIVPVYLIFEEPYLYGFSTLGQKIQWMRINSQVCVELEEFRTWDQWKTVLVFGKYEELPDLPRWQQVRQEAHAILDRYASWWEPACASRQQSDTLDLMAHVFYRIRIERITGRQAHPEAREKLAEKA